MKNGNYTLDNGDIIWLNFTPQTGHERRVAVVLSLKTYNEKINLCIVVLITSKIKDYTFEVALPNNLEIKGVVLADQIKSLDFIKREAKFIFKPAFPIT